MREMADVHDELIRDEALLFGMLDSSPQGGRNWMMSEYAGIRGSDIEDAAESAPAGVHLRWRH